MVSIALIFYKDGNMFIYTQSPSEYWMLGIKPKIACFEEAGGRSVRMN